MNQMNLTTSGSTTACIINEPYPWSNSCTTYIQPYFYSYPVVQTYPYQIRTVENGFILSINGKEYVFESQSALLRFLGQELKTK